MSSTFSYVSELESVIANKLLPVYEKYCQQNNIPIDINSSLLKEIKRKKILPALLRPKETCA